MYVYIYVHMYIVYFNLLTFCSKYKLVFLHHLDWL